MTYSEELETEMIKNPKDYPKPWWALYQVTRTSGVVEDVCEHGCGHPNADYLKDNTEKVQKERLGIHGCCGCCKLTKRGF